MQLIKIRIEDLTPYEKNTKKHTPEQIEQIKDSIVAFGNSDPIGVAGDNNVIIEGNGRYIALKELGYEEAYCIRLDHLTESERKAYAIAHNKINANTGFDMDLLREEMESLQDVDFDLELTAFADWELDNLLNPVSDEDLRDFLWKKNRKKKNQRKQNAHRAGASLSYETLPCRDKWCIRKHKTSLDGSAIFVGELLLFQRISKAAYKKCGFVFA